MTTFAITLAYTAFVGLVDACSGANYMFLRRPPGNWTLLQSARSVALVHRQRRRRRPRSPRRARLSLLAGPPASWLRA